MNKNKKNIVCEKKVLKDCYRPKINYVVNNNGSGGSGNVICVGETGIPGPQGEIGQTGLSAYEIDLINGYVGSYEDWLETLKGPTGPPAQVGGVIPYNLFQSSLYHEASTAEQQFEIAILAFNKFQNNIGNIENINEITYSSVINSFYCFVAQKDMALIGTSLEANGSFEFSEGKMNLKAMVYTSPPNSAVFTSVPETTLTLLPKPVLSNANVIVSGQNQYYYPVAAGTKIIMVMFVEGYDFIDDAFYHWEGGARGGLNYIELT